MYLLPDVSLKAILKDWHPQKYNPPCTDVEEWTHSIELLCDAYGIPDVQRSECATCFVKDRFATELLGVLSVARETYGPLRWDQFKSLMVVIDEVLREQWKKLPFYNKHPKLVGTALAVTGGMLLAPAAASVLSYTGLIYIGGAAGSIPATIQSIICNRAAGGLFSLLQPAGATGLLQSMGTTALLQSGGTATVLSSVGATVAGAATTSAGVVLTVNGEPIASASRDLLQEAVESVQHCDNPDDGEKGIPPPDHATVTEKYLLTLLAILAIVKSWDVGTYDPPGTNCTSWLCEVHGLCKQYGVPLAQRALCAMHRMRADCKEAAHNAKCHDMTWDEFTAWLCQYDREDRKGADRRIAELQANTLEK